MAFVKGSSGNPGGRPKGAKGKSNEKIKLLVEKLILKNAKSIEVDFAGLKGKDKIAALTAMLHYVIPKQQSTSLDLDLEKLSDEQIDNLYNRVITGVNMRATA
jgi:hypothetical protein